MAGPSILLDLDFLPPGRMGAPRIIGGALEGGTAQSGIVLASDISGGGLIALDYLDIQLGDGTRDQTLFYNRLTMALRGGIRTCVVPFLVDAYSPCSDSFWASGAGSQQVNDGNLLTTLSDGTTFSDGTSFAQPNVTGAITAAGKSGDATISLNVKNGRALQGGEWFGVIHPTKSYRAYCVTDVDTQTTSGGDSVATVAIRPPLRDVINVGMNVDWWRPRCLMKLNKNGSDPIMNLEGFWRGQVNLSFIEAFNF